MRMVGKPLAVVIATAALVLLGAIVGVLIAAEDDDAGGSPGTAPSIRAEPALPEKATTGTRLDSDDVPLGRAEAKRAGAAAVAALGGGIVVEIERSDDPGEAYEVEVMTDRGEVDVALDDNFRRVDNVPYSD